MSVASQKWHIFDRKKASLDTFLSCRTPKEFCCMCICPMMWLVVFPASWQRQWFSELWPAFSVSVHRSSRLSAAAPVELKAQHPDWQQIFTDRNIFNVSSIGRNQECLSLWSWSIDVDLVIKLKIHKQWDICMIWTAVSPDYASLNTINRLRPLKQNLGGLWLPWRWL